MDHLSDQILEALAQHDGTRAAPMSPDGAWLCYCGVKIGTREAWVAHQAEVLRPLVTPNHYADLIPAQPEPEPTRAPRGVWRHRDDLSHCSSYPDSFDWAFVEEPWRCSSHDRTLVCLLRMADR